MDHQIIFTILFAAAAWPLNVKTAQWLKNNPYKLWILLALFAAEFFLFYLLIWNRSWIYMLLLVLGYIPAIIMTIKQGQS